MKNIFNKIDSLNIEFKYKVNMFLSFTVVVSALLGILFWYLIHFFIFKDSSWAFCFVVYPGFFLGFIGGALYLFKHDFKHLH